MKITVINSGKIKEPFASIAKSYHKRSRAFVKLDELSLKDDSKFEAKLLSLKEKLNARLILLDERGITMSSRDFAGFLKKKELQSENLLFVTGPADGFSDEIKQTADSLFSLSSFTLAHDFANALFAEVLYRSLSIKANHPYHRD